MRFFFGYALRETRTNLWRNRMMTLAAVLTVAVSLFLVGGALFLKQSASQAAETWQNQTRVQIWMTPSASASEIAAVQDRLTTLPYVSTCTYFDKAAALAEAKRITAPNIAANLTLALVPTKYVCTPKIPSDTTLIESTFTGEPGVLQVTAPDQTIKTMEQDVRVMQIVCLSIALLLVIAAMVQILNTIRMAIYARRREVAVMKLVGATNWFIRIPFMSEGFIQGLLGSAVACGALVALHSAYPLSNEYALSTSSLVGTLAVVVVFGTALGSLGSALAVRRFLDV